MDKRILKTKRNIKATLIELLDEKPFEDITVSELCRKGEVSRITFYTYYDDKFDLVHELLDDYVEYARVSYRELQNKNNLNKNPLRSYENLLGCILGICKDKIEFFKHLNNKENPYLFSAYNECLMTGIVEFINNHERLIKGRYPANITAAFIASGLWGVINEAVYSGASFEEAEGYVRSMFRNIIESNMFYDS